MAALGAAPGGRVAGLGAGRSGPGRAGGEVVAVLTIAKLSRHSVDYYNRTASEAKAAHLDRQAANGGLAEYYSEKDTRAPSWLVVGDRQGVGERVGLDAAAVAGGPADPEVVAAWLDEGIAPNGAQGRAFGARSVHGFDLTFAAPKSVSLLRALRRGEGSTEIVDKAVLTAHEAAVEAAMTYLHEHAGWTRTHNPVTGHKDLQRLPGLVAAAYQHETSRCGDPHLHTHVLVPNRQARADGTLVSLDGNSLFHEAKAAGVIYQAVLRHELHQLIGVEWRAVDPHTGMAEVAGITRAALRAWSQRASQLREWAAGHLAADAGAPTAAQLAAAQKATRPKKPESLSWGELVEQWRADPRGLELERPEHHEARQAREAAPRLFTDRARLVAALDKATPTRADIVERVGALLPVDAPGNPREVIEHITDTVAVRISDPREAHQREGSVRYTVDAIIVEERAILDLVDARDPRARLDVRAQDLDALSDDQASAIRAIATSPWLVQPLQAPAGAGKTHSLKALRAAAHRSGKQVLVVAPTGVAVDQAVRDGAGDRGLTAAKFLAELEDGRLQLTARTVVVVDEAGMLGTHDLGRLLAATTAAKVKTVPVGDAHQLAPVKQRGGMFEMLCTELPWAQELTEVWRQRDPAERDASLALRDGTGNRLRTAIGWYREHGRLHTGGAVAMAADATDTYIAARTAGDDVTILCDRREVAAAINQRLQAHYTGADKEGPAVSIGHDDSHEHARRGDLIVTHRNDATIDVRDAAGSDQPADQVRNGQRWEVAAVDAEGGRIAARRLSDGARAVLAGDYLREHVSLGYATTVHAAQGITVGGTGHDGVERRGIALTVMSDRATRALAYVGLTRAKDENHAYIYPAAGNEDDDAANRRGTKEEASVALHHLVTTRDERPQTMHAIAERADRSSLNASVAQLLDRNDTRRADRAAAWDQHLTEAARFQAAYERVTTTTEHSHSRDLSRSRDYGFEL